MELRHIRYFLAVAEERHFTRGAAKVGIGQPPLSQQIKDLEVEVGAPLFHRLAHGAELTPAGEAFLEVVKEMPGLAERATKAARRAARGETGSLRVGFTASSAFNAVVPGTIRAFRRAYPDVDLTLEEANTTRLVASLQDGFLDAAFLRPGAPGSEAFQLRLLSEEPMVVALPANHPCAAGPDVDHFRTEGPDLQFPYCFRASVSPTLYDSVIGACRNAGFDPRDRTSGSAHGLDHNAGGRGTWRLDRTGIDEPAAGRRRRLSRDCRREARSRGWRWPTVAARRRPSYRNLRRTGGGG